MKLFIDIGHPAHVHYFKNTIKSLMKDGHTLMICAREKDVTHKLLKSYNIPFITRGKGGFGLFGKFFYLLKANLQLYKLAKNFEPDLFLSFASPYAGQVATILKKPHISFTDTEHAKLGILAFLPFCDFVITPKVYKNDLGNKHIRFDGYMEQSYLSSSYFNPNKKKLRNLNLKNNQQYVIIRLVSWDASHDIGERGFTKEYLIKLIQTIENYAKVFISSEGCIPKILEKYKLMINPIDIHDILYYATLFIGEGATMASECAVMGTPSIYVNSLTAGTLEDQEKNGLVFIYNSTDGVLNKATELLEDSDTKINQQQKCSQVMKNKINVNNFIKWLVLNYPKSIDELNENPDIQYSLK